MERMNCEEAMQAFLNAKEMGTVCDKAVEQHLRECEVCRQAVAETDLLFETISKDVVLPPPPSIRKAFEMALTNELAGSSKMIAPRRTIFRSRFVITAAACALLVAGIGIGHFLTRTNDKRPFTETVKGNQTDSVTATSYQSSSDRIETINTSVEKSAPNDSLLVTLTSILASDKNSNVRMAALYALTKYADDPYVHKRLIAALARETEPVIQVLLINLLTEKKGPGSMNAIQDLIKNEGTRKEVKMVAQTKLSSL
jgi:hypothetical protein